MQVALTIAGSDSSGGAGLQADLKTFQSLGLFGLSAVTAITVQNTQKVYAVEEVKVSMVRDQILCLFDDFEIDVVKIGMVSSSKIAMVIAETLKAVTNCPIVLDPVMISKSGYSLLCEEAKEVLLSELFPIATVITPNLYEAEIITESNIASVEDMKVAAKKISSMNNGNVIVKGGHLMGELAIDVVFNGEIFNLLQKQRIKTVNTHGTGCTFSSAVAAFMAKGYSFFRAVLFAKEYISGAISNALDIGKGCGPTNHFFDLYKKAGLF